MQPIIIKNKIIIYKLVIVQCLGTAFLGYCFCAFNPCQDIFAFYNKWDTEDKRNLYIGTLTSIPLIGATISSTIVSQLSKRCNSHNDLTLKQDILSILSILILLYSTDFVYQLIGRLLFGFTFGIISCIIPYYIN